MRVTGGREKGRRLATFRGLDIRPTSDLVREAIFDIIGHDLRGLRALDLFAGTGSLGIEALSRGASWALFVDHSQRAIDLVKSNLRICGFEDVGFTLKRNLTRGLPKSPFLPREKIDLAFLDPPYDKDLMIPLLVDLMKREMLVTPSLVVAETRKNAILPAAIGTLHLVRSRTYGDTGIHIFKNRGDD